MRQLLRQNRYSILERKVIEVKETGAGADTRKKKVDVIRRRMAPPPGVQSDDSEVSSEDDEDAKECAYSRTAYMIFYDECAEKEKKSYSGAKMLNFTQQVNAAWATTDRKKYQHMATIELQRYNRELKSTGNRIAPSCKHVLIWTVCV